MSTPYAPSERARAAVAALRAFAAAMFPLPQAVAGRPAPPAEQTGTAARWLPLRAAGLSATQLLAITAQLTLVALAIYLFRLEESFGFPKVLPLIVVGFVVHACLPLRLRLPFFLALSLASIAVVLRFPHNVGLIGLGMILIGLCHLPIAHNARVAVVLVAAALLAAVRGEWLQTSWQSLPTLVLPILGSMFMFRLIIYLYDLRHEKKPASLWERLSYFFLLPNACFPLFPVIDYQTFRRTYYDAAPLEIYQKGVLWMLRGTTHLLLYRLVYYYLIPSPEDVQGLGGVVQFMVATYLLYLRISGQFHLIVGVLCLFGFNLPETHHLYLLASGFNDYWRRINIYWKDFMTKIFYYPAFMRLRKYGVTTAMAAATAVVFVATWILHSYQWFWLQGSFPMTAPDTLFWGILGALVVLNSLTEARRGRRRTSKKGWDLRAAVVHSLKTVGMFAFICVLWSLWSSSSVGEWVALVSEAADSTIRDYALLALALGLLAAGGVFAQYAAARGWELSLVGNKPSFARSAAYTGSVALLLVVLGLPATHAGLGGEAAGVVASLQSSHANERDRGRMERGYYEGLLNADGFTSTLWAVQMAQDARPAEDWAGIRQTGATRDTGDLLEYELIPSHESTISRAALRTNAHGMRDREYTLEKPAGVYRIALLGASYAMGAGVTHEEHFETLVEERLNRDNAGGQYSGYELLNFGVAGYSAVQNALVAEWKVPRFAPDAVLYLGHIHEEARLLEHLTRLVLAGRVVEDEYLQSVIRRAGADAGMEKAEVERRLRPFADEVIATGFRRVVEASRARGATPLWVFLPTVGESRKIDRGRYDKVARAAQEAGFITLSIEDAYGDFPIAEVQLAPWDNHPTAFGHTLVADRLYRLLREHAGELGLGPTTEDARGAASGGIDGKETCHG